MDAMRGGVVAPGEQQDVLALLNRLPPLVEEGDREGDDAAVRFSNFALFLDNDPGVDGVAH